MDINLRHAYLGTTPEPIAQSRAKVIISIIGLLLTCWMLCCDQMNLIKHKERAKIARVKVKAKRRAQEFIALIQ